MSADLLTLPELAEHLGCSVRTLHRRRTAAGPSAPHGTRMGRRLHFPRTAVETWAGEHLVSTRARSDGLTGVLLDHVVEPGSSEWLTRMSASKIAAVVGLSPYESRFSLWYRMAELAPLAQQSDVMTRGHLLEPAVAQWWAEQNPDAQVSTTGTWALATDSRMVASPDRLVVQDGRAELLEVKTAAHDDEWTPDFDGIPIGYRCQCQWQMLVTGATVTHVAVLLPRLEFRAYVIDRDVDECAALLAAAEQFLDTLPGQPGEQVPDLDSHGATYETVRAMHPDIEDVEVELDDDMADRYLTARAALKAAETEARGSASAVLQHMGRARHAVRDDGTKVASRQPNGTHLPKLVANPKAVTAAAANTRSAA